MALILILSLPALPNLCLGLYGGAGLLASRKEGTKGEVVLVEGTAETFVSPKRNKAETLRFQEKKEA